MMWIARFFRRKPADAPMVHKDHHYCVWREDHIWQCCMCPARCDDRKGRP